MYVVMTFPPFEEELTKERENSQLSQTSFSLYIPPLFQMCFLLADAGDLLTPLVLRVTGNCQLIKSPSQEDGVGTPFA